jgi:hypothetical protein
MVGAVLGPGAAHAQPSPTPASSSDAEECARRESIAAAITRFEAARTAGRPFDQLLAQMAEIEKRIIELQPGTGKSCADALSIAGLTDRFDPIRHEVISEGRRKEINAKPWPERVKLAVLEHRVEIGMTRDQVTAAWGKPKSVDVTAVHGDEQWTYSGPTYLVFTNGALASIARVRKPAE